MAGVAGHFIKVKCQIRDRGLLSKSVCRRVQQELCIEEQEECNPAPAFVLNDRPAAGTNIVRLEGRAERERDAVDLAPRVRAEVKRRLFLLCNEGERVAVTGHGRTRACLRARCAPVASRTQRDDCNKQKSDKREYHSARKVQSHGVGTSLAWDEQLDRCSVPSNWMGDKRRIAIIRPFRDLVIHLSERHPWPLGIGTN